MEHSLGRAVKIVAGCAAALALTGCSAPVVAGVDEEPIVVEAIDGTDIQRMMLSQSAADRLDIRTTVVEQAADGLVVPSAAVIIDPVGAYWVYTSPQPLVFVRRQIQPVREAGQRAFYEIGPDVGTAVVITGVPELYGAEFGIGK